MLPGFQVVTIRILAFLGSCILALLKAVCSPLMEIFAGNLLRGMRLQYTLLKEIASLQCSGHLIRKVYLLCQHNS